MYIYEIIYNADGFTYIGKCQNSHQNSKTYYGSGKYIKSAIKKHGKENFVKNILEVLPEGSTKEQLAEREKHWIKEKDCIYPNGYNLSAGGEGAQLFGEKNGMYGKHPKSWCKGLTKENCKSLKVAGEKISLAVKGVKRPSFHPDHRGVNNPMHGRGGINNPRFGKRYTCHKTSLQNYRRWTKYKIIKVLYYLIIFTFAPKFKKI